MSSEPSPDAVSKAEIGPNKLPDARPHLLHVLPSFEVGGIQVRTAAIINHLKMRYRHTILALNSNYQCRSQIDESLEVSYPAEPPQSGNLIASFRAAHRTLKATKPDLLMTYNWATLDWASINALFRFCPHIHHEDGFNLDEADGQKLRRVLYRRLCLRRTSRLIVPSRSLLAIASQSWKVEPDRLSHIPNGIDASRFRLSEPPSRPAALQDLVVIGTVAPLRPEKNLQMLFQAVASLGPAAPVGILIAGDGPERSRLESLARTLELASRTIFLGHVDDIAAAFSMIDIFALTSKTEQMPLSVLQAMAAAKPIVSVDVGDVKHIVSPKNQPFVVPRDDTNALGQSLQRLMDDEKIRREIGRSNAERVRDHYRADTMVEVHARIIAKTLEDDLGRAR